MKHFCRVAAAGLLLTMPCCALPQANDARDDNPAYVHLSISEFVSQADLMLRQRPSMPPREVGSALAAATSLDRRGRDPSTGTTSEGWWYVGLSGSRGAALGGLALHRRFDPGPLRPILEGAGATWLIVEIECPRWAQLSVSGSTDLRRLSPSRYECAYPLDSDRLPELSISYGYAGPVLAINVCLLACLFLGACLLVRHARERALSAPPSDAEAAWFSYARRSQAISIGAVVLWIASYFVTGAARTAMLMGSALSTKASPAFMGLLLLPAGAIVALVAWMSHPVCRRVRGMRWTAADLAKIALLRLLAITVPLACAGSGLEALVTDDTRFAVIAFALAGLSYYVLVSALASASDFTPNALTTGALRDRVFALAAKAEVRANQLYVLPSGRGLVSNAFALTNGSVMVSELLIRSLTRREVDGVAAHELAHLSLRHPLKLRLMAFLLVLALGATLGPALDSGSPWWIAGGVAAIVLAFFARYAYSRRIEFAADRLAVRLTGDPEALISGLARIMRQNVLPADWTRAQERTMTHPSLVRRAARIANECGLPQDRVAELLAGPPPAAIGEPGATDEPYSVPSLDQRQPLFSARFRGTHGLRLYWAMLFSLALLPACVVRWAPGTGVLVWLLATAAGALGAWIAGDQINRRGYGSLAKRIRERSSEDGFPGDRGLILGLAPGAQARVFDGAYEWDCGIVWLSADRLIYRGEQAQFAVPREWLLAAQCETSLPSWVRRIVVVVKWGDSGSGASGEFQLRPLSPRGVGHGSRVARDLAAAIEAWRAGTSASSVGLPITWPDDMPAPEMPAGLTLGEVTSRSPREAARKGLVSSLIRTALVAAGVSVLFDLPFDPDAGAMAWSVVASAVLGWVILQAPLLLSRRE